jgi:hypothetical protein
VIHFPNYLLRLEQLLAVRCATIDKINSGFLNGEREIIDGNLQLCLAFPKSISMRLVLAQTLLGMKKVRPDLVAEFEDKIKLLQKEEPLQEPVQSLLQRILDEATAM